MNKKTLNQLKKQKNDNKNVVKDFNFPENTIDLCSNHISIFKLL